MKEKPILLSGPMVRAILEGSKTQTRRIMKPQPPEDWTPGYYGPNHKMTEHGHFPLRNGLPIEIGWGVCNQDGDWCLTCPYGKPGDRLWVKETWRVRGGREYEYQQHQGSVVYRASTDVLDDTCSEWRPSIFMPRCASRIDLEVTAIRVERLQWISHADAMREGVRPDDCEVLSVKGKGGQGMSPDYVSGYRKLWESINGAGSWDDNPLVWVIEFILEDQLAQKNKPTEKGCCYKLEQKANSVELT